MDRCDKSHVIDQSSAQRAMAGYERTKVSDNASGDGRVRSSARDELRSAYYSVLPCATHKCRPVPDGEGNTF